MSQLVDALCYGRRIEELEKQLHDTEKKFKESEELINLLHSRLEYFEGETSRLEQKIHDRVQEAVRDYFLNNDLKGLEIEKINSLIQNQLCIEFDLDGHIKEQIIRALQAVFSQIDVRNLLQNSYCSYS